MRASENKPLEGFVKTEAVASEAKGEVLDIDGGKPEGAPLRPHHGLCGEFFRGEGYSAEFVLNMRNVLKSLDEKDPEITLTVGGDIICAACPENRRGMCASAEKSNRYDRAVLWLCGLEEGDTLRRSAFQSLVREKIIDAGRLSEVCGDCMWFYICGK